MIQVFFRGKSHFEDDGMQKYLLFQQVYNFLKLLLMVVKLQHGNQEGCLMKVLNLHQRLIIILIQE